MSLESSKNNEVSNAWVSVGQALDWSEAGYLKHELERAGITAKFEHDLSKSKKNPSHVKVSVSPGDLQQALEIRETYLADPSPSHHSSKTHRLKAGIGAIFGLVMGLRVGEHLTKNPIGILIFALGLAAAAYFGIQGVWPDGKT